MRTLVTLLILLPVWVSGQNFQTLTYFEDDSVSLQLDLFQPSGNTKGVPLAIFIHGGGFAGGERADGHLIAEYLQQKGMAVACISYPLYMKGRDFSCGGITSEKVKAIQIAANATWAATAFLRKKARNLRIDRDRIFLVGSSAGAETLLHAAYWDRNQMSLVSNDLPKGFTYAGLVSAAGAIMDLNLITADNQIPTMVYHGTDDPLVPYQTAAHHYCPPSATGWLMLFGSRTVYEHMVSLGGHACLLTYCGAEHEVSGFHLADNHEPIWEFIQEVLENRPSQVHRVYGNTSGGECN